ncbi:hypothetical protein EHS25_004925 [Saitozyma podzolica]|uniref:Uncharacterized protein n=1 Tax=Saitozyma podzolica TaxID=1890683 RepID=A0A427Y381_9TREE|nr:hypothetical protein EHS25_004925 [Saitozyma podzolica]
MSPNGDHPLDDITIIGGTVMRLKGRHVLRDYERQLRAQTKVAVWYPDPISCVKFAPDPSPLHNLQVLRISPQDCSRLRRQDSCKGADARGYPYSAPVNAPRASQAHPVLCPCNWTFFELAGSFLHRYLELPPDPTGLMGHIDVLVSSSLLVRDAGSSSTNLFKRGTRKPPPTQLEKTASRREVEASHRQARNDLLLRASRRSQSVAPTGSVFTFMLVSYTVKTPSGDKELLDDVSGMVGPSG